MISKKSIKSHHTSFIIILIFILYNQILPQSINTYVLGIPGYERLIEQLNKEGYNASLYGSLGRPANQFEVILIGEQVPASAALHAILLSKRIIPTLKYVFLRNDIKNPAFTPQTIAIGITNHVVEEFSNVEDFFGVNLRGLSESNIDLKDFQQLVRSRYKTTNTGNNSSNSNDMFVREDGILVIPQSDGTALLYDLRGHQGVKGLDGNERWFRENIIQKIPVQPAGSIDPQWLDDLNNWLSNINDGMLKDIELILNNPNSMQNYKSLESKNCTTLYEKFNLRKDYLNLLVKNKFKTTE